MKLKKIMKQTIASLTTLSLLLGSGVNVFANSRNVNIYIDSKKVEFSDVNPVFENNRILTPFSATLEHLGATDIKWDPDNRTGSAKLGDNSFTIVDKSSIAFVNGKTVSLDVPAEIRDNRFIIPFRFVSEALNFDVKWDDTTNLVTVTSKEVEKEVAIYGKVISNSLASNNHIIKLATGSPVVGKIGEIVLDGKEEIVTIPANVSVNDISQGLTTQITPSKITVDSVITVVKKRTSVISVFVYKIGGAEITPEIPDPEKENEAVFILDNKSDSSVNLKYESKTKDQNVLLVRGSRGDLRMSGGTLNKTGDSPNPEKYFNSGINAVVSVIKEAYANLSNTEIFSTANGSPGLFVNENNSKANFDSGKIELKGDYSPGVMALQQSVMDVSNSNIITSGSYSPLFYSNSTLNVTKVTGNAGRSQIGVVEGLNSLIIKDSTLYGEDKYGFTLQSTTSTNSKYNTESLALLSLINSRISTNTNSSALFFVDDVDSKITLSYTTLPSVSTLLKITSDSTNVEVTVEARDQKLNGNIEMSKGTELFLNLTDASIFTGTIDRDNRADYVRVQIDQTSRFELTGDSYIDVFDNVDRNCKNVLSGGYNIYYDSTHRDNDWLNREKFQLPEGGYLIPYDYNN